MFSMCSCVEKVYDNIDDVTYPGFVAFDYTGDVINNYLSILKNLYGFNEYISQPTMEKRDSVDRIYFSGIKILREENKDMWTLILSYGYDYMSINTYGKTLNDDNAKWQISFYSRNYFNELTKKAEFEIEKIGELHWHIKKHDNNNYDFDYSSEWNIKLSSSGDIVKIEGSGSLLSIKSPSLKIDFTITEPFDASNKYNILSISSGKIKILATDVDKDITEETIAEIFMGYDIIITYKNKSKNYRYTFSK